MKDRWGTEITGKTKRRQTSEVPQASDASNYFNIFIIDLASTLRTSSYLNMLADDAEI